MKLITWSNRNRWFWAFAVVPFPVIFIPFALRDLNLITIEMGWFAALVVPILLISVVGMLRIFSIERAYNRSASASGRAEKPYRENRAYGLALPISLGTIYLSGWLSDIVGVPKSVAGLILFPLYAVWLWYALVKD